MLELKELTEKTLELFECNSVEELGNALMLSLDNEYKLYKFSRLVEDDLTKDWLQMIFQYYQADRQDKKQDYTPKCLAQFLSRLVGESSESIDMCAGSGALTIQRWLENPDTVFQCYEIDENVIPYLLFNLVVRNITATVKRGDILENEIYEIWEITKGERYGKITHIKSTI